jgi:GPH family glycoside/pentoside/hexuronide:cation symporter
MLFAIPTGLTGWGLFACVTAISLVLRICHSLFNLPYIALGAELSDDYGERTRIVAARFLVTVAGAAGCLTLGTKVFMGGPNGLLNRAGYAPFGLACGAMIAFGGLVASFGTVGAIRRLHVTAPGQASAARQFLRDVVEMARNRSFVVLFGSLLLTFVAGGIVQSLNLHTYRFFWRLRTDETQLVLLSTPAGTLAGVISSFLFIHRLDKRLVVMAGLGVYCLQLAVVPLLGVTGVLPPGSPAAVAVLAGAGCLTYAFGAALGIAFQSAFADAADEHEHLFGTRREGLFFAGLNFASKAAGGLGGLLAGLGLDLIRFPTNLAAHGGANVRVDPVTATHLALLYGPGPAVLVFLAIVVFARYRLSRGAHDRIQADLRRRHAAAAAQ